eukprot:807935_1
MRMECKEYLGRLTVVDMQIEIGRRKKSRKRWKNKANVNQTMTKQRKEIDKIALKNSKRLNKYKKQLRQEMEMRIEIEKQKCEIQNEQSVKNEQEFKNELAAQYKHLVDGAYCTEENKLKEEHSQEMMALKYEKKKAISSCKNLQKRLFKLKRIERKKDGELEKLRIGHGIANEGDREENGNGDTV